jgi:hypothetical protein
MIDLLTKALWFTLSAYIIFIISRWFYKRYLKAEKAPYFYFKSLKEDRENASWSLRLEAPVDDFEIDIIVLLNKEILFTKNARLKAGINRILIPLESNGDQDIRIEIKSSTQKIERSFIESEI